MPRTFTVTFTDKGDGTVAADTTNNGFTASEIYLLLEIKKQDIMSQVTSTVKFKRTLVHDGKTYDISRKRGL